jgi:hypothetical protein
LGIVFSVQGLVKAYIFIKKNCDLKINNTPLFHMKVKRGLTIKCFWRGMLPFTCCHSFCQLLFLLSVTIPSVSNYYLSLTITSFSNYYSCQLLLLLSVTITSVRYFWAHHQRPVVRNALLHLFHLARNALLHVLPVQLEEGCRD